ncbi:MAG: hypothetical protein HRU18_02945 [Pseudoalteromonas sp.]|uniref:hypothetical protein n=1 Tax=Pseudoalteromonas sp. TaxID=53249 RepID=UPI001D4326D0|nr:hypothetical protein [Pseudoalteromonas sp.]NRA77142.1 hypothetical protein [Pseudoalteromonas sp.]
MAAISWRNVGLQESRTALPTGSQEGIGGAFNALGSALSTIESTRNKIGSNRLQRELDGAQSQEQVDGIQRDSSSFFSPSEGQFNSQIAERGAAIAQQDAAEREVSEVNRANTYTDNLRGVSDSIRTSQGTGVSLDDQNASLFSSEAYKSLTPEDKLNAKNEITNDFIQRSALSGEQSAIAKAAGNKDNLALTEVEANYDDLERQVFGDSGISQDAWNAFKDEEPMSVGDAVQGAAGQGIVETSMASDLENEANKHFEKLVGRKIKGAELNLLLKSTGATENWELFSDNFMEFNGGVFKVRAKELADQLVRIKEVSPRVNKAITALKGERDTAKNQIGSRATTRLKNLESNARARNRGETVDAYTPDALAGNFVVNATANGERILRNLAASTNKRGDVTAKKPKVKIAPEAKVTKADEPTSLPGVTKRTLDLVNRE